MCIMTFLPSEAFSTNLSAKGMAAQALRMSRKATKHAASAPHDETGRGYVVSPAPLEAISQLISTLSSFHKDAAFFAT